MCVGTTKVVISAENIAVLYDECVIMLTFNRFFVPWLSRERGGREREKSDTPKNMQKQTQETDKVANEQIT